MTTVKKLVRFYEPRWLDGAGKRKAITGGDFWALLRSKIQPLTVAQRECVFNGVTYFGEARLAKKPAVNYVYLGRIRPAADHPDGYRPNAGSIGPLTPAQAGDLISEPSYLLPFGTQNFTAMLSPITGATRVPAVERWLNHVFGLLPTPDQIVLSPITDEKVLDKLQQAAGATRLYVQMKPGASVPQQGGGVVGGAIRNAAANTNTELALEMSWSFGHGYASGSQGWKNALLQAANFVAQGDFASKAEVNMQIPEGNGLRTEIHDLFLDRVAFPTTIQVPAGQSPTEESVLQGMQEAIEKFRKQM
ncbi:MAG: hypothetical protein JWO67_6399 [Streptosporangiaceae bacterium]|nr:hypothetical protein [Streptosporangiaceae bacterium]